MKHKQKVLCFAVILLALAAPRGVISQNIWTPTNGVYGGNISKAALSPNGEIFIATQGARVFTSTNDGANWIEKAQGLPNSLDNDVFHIASLAVDSSGNVFAGVHNK